MSPREIADSFVPFVQVDSRLARRTPGSGLGLPITKRLIEMHGGRLALEHLYSLGHRKIAFIRGPKMLIDTAPRWRGIEKFAKSVGLEIDSSLVAQLPESFDANSGFDGGYRCAEEWLHRKRKFTAVLAFDDLTATGAIRALTKHGVKVPEQCSVIGFDDVPL